MHSDNYRKTFPALVYTGDESGLYVWSERLLLLNKDTSKFFQEAMNIWVWKLTPELFVGKQLVSYLTTSCLYIHVNELLKQIFKSWWISPTFHTFFCLCCYNVLLCIDTQESKCWFLCLYILTIASQGNIIDVEWFLFIIPLVLRIINNRHGASHGQQWIVPIVHFCKKNSVILFICIFELGSLLCVPFKQPSGSQQADSDDNSQSGEWDT